MASVRHLGLVAHDLTRLQDFYLTVFNLRFKERKVEKGTFIEQLTKVPGACLEWVKLEGDNGVLVELLHYHGMDTPRPRAHLARQGETHMAFTVQDAMQTAESIHKMGGKAGIPLRNPEGSVLVFYAHDPEGNQLEIVQPLSVPHLSLRGLRADKSMDYENGFYYFSDCSRVAKLLGQYELYRKIMHLPGSIVETGVFKGSTLLRLATFRKLLESDSRCIFAFDMFCEFPQACAQSDELWYAKSYDANFGVGLSVEEMSVLLAAKGLTNNVTLIAGDICQTMTGYFKNKELAFVHVDVELYAPTKVILEECWPQLVSGGLMVFDDYDEPTNAKVAIDEFVSLHGIHLEKLPFVDTPVYCVKE